VFSIKPLLIGIIVFLFIVYTAYAQIMDCIFSSKK